MWRAVAICCLAVLLASFVGSEEETTKKAPAFSLKDLDRKEVVLDSLLGKGPVIIDFWATWCKPCLIELDRIRDLYREFKEKGLTVLAVNEDDPRNVSKVKPMAASHRWDFHVLLDPNKKVKRLYQVMAFPTTFVLDAEGNIRNKHVGYTPGSENELKNEIEELLLPPQSEPDSTTRKREREGVSD